MLKNVKAKTTLKYSIIVIISAVLAVILIQGIISKKILFLKYGIIEGFYKEHYKVIKIEKIDSINDYDVYIINSKRSKYNTIENAWSTSTCYYYGEHLYIHYPRKVYNVYFIKGYSIYDLREIMEKKLIDSDILFDVLSDKNINVIPWEEYIVPLCINLN